ncbi:iron ABC transporter permease [Pengzhenrongella frigida]|uniref:Iron ABC transporter permease n=1 Tax=Pengzhenrongella frigida TaxID=1259133 RepID=A0A4Q5MZ25_9MICO|nr:iron ABC transporter permease [Cellulomonas sp. HLT2-17]
MLVALLVTLPLLYVVGYTVDAGWAQVSRLVFRARVLELTWNTVRLTLAAIAMCALVGTTTAWLVGRTALRGRRLWHVLMVAPLAIPAFVNSYAWVSLVPGLHGFGGALLIVTLSYFPLVYLPVSAMLGGLDPALEEVSRSLGFGSWGTFRRVVLPQLRPALLGGSLLVGLHLLAEFGALRMLQYPTFTTAIYDQYRSSFAGPAANSLATVLVIACLFLLLTELRLRGHRHLARVGHGTARATTRLRAGRWATPGLVLVASVAVLAVGLPMAMLARWLWVGSSTTLELGTLTATLTQSLLLGLVAALATTALALPVAWLSVRHAGPFATLLERSTYVSSALPGIVVALALVTLTISFAQPWYQTAPVLVIAYVILFMPRAMVGLQAAIRQVPPALDEVASSLGAGVVARFARVTLPLIAPGAGAGAALVFLAVITELTSTLLLAPIGTETLATTFWGYSSSLAYGAAAPYAVLMVVLSLPATYLLTRPTRKGHLR